MPKDQRGVEHSLQFLDHLQTPEPRIVITGQPAVRMSHLVVFRDVELIRRIDERTILLQIHLHDTKAWRVTR